MWIALESRLSHMIEFLDMREDCFSNAEIYPGSAADTVAGLSKKIKLESRTRAWSSIVRVSIAVIIMSALYIWARIIVAGSSRVVDGSAPAGGDPVSLGEADFGSGFTGSMLGVVSVAAALSVALVALSWKNWERRGEDGAWLRRIRDSAHRENSSRMLMYVLAVFCGCAAVANGFHLWVQHGRRQAVHENDIIMAILIFSLYAVVAALPSIMGDSENVTMSSYASVLQRLARLEVFARSLGPAFQLCERRWERGRWGRLVEACPRRRTLKEISRGVCRDEFLKLVGAELGSRSLVRACTALLTPVGLLVLVVIWFRASFHLGLIVVPASLIANSCLMCSGRDSVFVQSISDREDGEEDIRGVTFYGLLVLVFWGFVVSVVEFALLFAVVYASKTGPGNYASAACLLALGSALSTAPWFCQVLRTVAADGAAIYSAHFRWLLLRACDRHVDELNTFRPLAMGAGREDIAIVTDAVIDELVQGVADKDAASRRLRDMIESSTGLPLPMRTSRNSLWTGLRRRLWALPRFWS